jgi:phage terminase small subunit
MFNATQAAIAAGYSPRSARELAAQNMSKPAIREAIDARLGELSKLSLMRADEILDHLSAMARVPVLDESGQFLDLGQARMVLSSLELLGKYHKLWTEKREISGTDGKPIQFALPRTEDSEPANLPEEGAP